MSKNSVVYIATVCIILRVYMILVSNTAAFHLRKIRNDGKRQEKSLDNVAAEFVSGQGK